MTIWVGIGVNYGHQISSLIYDATQIESDFTYLRSAGVTRLRIAFPEYDGSAGLIANCQNMVTRALAHGFYVVWGVTVGFGAGTITATRWSAFKTNVIGTIAPWAQSVGLSELCLANENELSDDGTTLTDATMRADIRTMASTIKTNGYTGKVSYSTSILSTYRTPWASEGIGSLDYIAWNSYDTSTNFNIRNAAIVSSFANVTYISEFGSITNGYSDYNNESAYYNDVVARISSMQSSGVASGYFFCYRDGQFGVPANSFGLIQTNGIAHLARQAVLGITNTSWSLFMA